MRSRLLPLMGVLTAMLLTGSTAVAQDQSEPGEATLVSGVQMQASRLEPGEASIASFDRLEQDPLPEGVERILEQNQRSVEWSDPRLPPLMLQRTWWDQREEGLVWALAATYRLQGPEGAWSGTGQGFATLDPETYVVDWHEQMVLAGEGAYEGLTALLTREEDFLEEVGIRYRYEGIIFEGDPPPVLEPFVAGEYGFEYPTEPLDD